MNLVDDISLNVYTRLLTPGDPRLRAVVEAIEAAFGERLDFVSAPKGHRRLKDRNSYLKQPGPNPIMLTNGKDGEREIRLWEISAWQAGSEGTNLFVFVAPSLAPVVSLRIALRQIARAAEGRYGCVGGEKLAHLHHLQDDCAEPGRPEGVPLLDPRLFYDSPDRPYRIGWMNYWSPEAVKILGVKPLDIERHPFAGVEFTLEGELLIELTKEPLDPDNPQHLALFVEAHRRFPGVGRVPGGKPVEFAPGCPITRRPRRG